MNDIMDNPYFIEAMMREINKLAMEGIKTEKPKDQLVKPNDIKPITPGKLKPITPTGTAKQLR